MENDLPTPPFSKEMQLSIISRLQDSLQLLRYFRLRDEMNAEVHNEDGITKVRYSPVTIAAERVFGWLENLAVQQTDYEYGDLQNWIEEGYPRSVVSHIGKKRDGQAAFSEK